ncbi:MAG TPA: DUF1552 domain-containing protein [Gemmataceae bacterium]|jgi:hypothetical protein|nr:DUF1552 domain-containing protein [Gemmataceae bacterium]
MSKAKHISRRTVLRGLGTAVALPWLEAMAPVISLAAGTPAKAPPRRLAFFYIPNGAHMPNWTPESDGLNFSLPPTLEPLAPFKKDLLVLSNLALDKARPNGDGPGDHARAMASFLTGRQARKTAGADIRIGISVDQLAATQVGKRTRFASLELGIERGLNAGNCDSGYSCAYSANLSWRTESMPMAKEVNPRLVFERLFAGAVKGEAEAARVKRSRYRLSVLDFVMEDAGQLKARLGTNDQRKLDEYLSAVRELEVQIARTDPLPNEADIGYARPAGTPPDYQDHARVMLDVLALAFRGDLTRISTMVFANDGSNRPYKSIGVPEGHHDLSHHGGNKEKQAKIAKINRFHISQLAYFLSKLKSIPEGESSLLDNCMIIYGGGIGDGNRHNHDELPILVAGKGGGTIKTGRHLRYPKDKDMPLTNLYVSLLDRMDVHVPSFGDSTGQLPDLS